MKKHIYFLFLFFIFSSFKALSFEIQKAEFPSKDGLMITADIYESANDNKPLILLCHQAGYSRGEYRSIAPKLVEQGYTCMAIDQRSGGEVNGVMNETYKRAEDKKLKTEYVDAWQDIEAAIDFLHKKYNRKIILWGSSYSASLTLLIAKSNDKIISAVAFSPGEYLAGIKVSDAIRGFSKPLFVTSSRKESTALTMLVDKVESKIFIQYIPVGNGTHGSKVLWNPDNKGERYWQQVTEFLDRVKL